MKRPRLNTKTWNNPYEAYGKDTNYIAVLTIIITTCWMVMPFMYLTTGILLTIYFMVIMRGLSLRKWKQQNTTK